MQKFSKNEALHLAIDELERLHCGPAREVAAWPAHEALAVRIALFWCVVMKRQTLFLGESRQPPAIALQMLSLQSGVPLNAVASRKVEDRDFARLTEAAAKISASPIFFEMEDYSGNTSETLWSLAREHEPEVLVSERKSLGGLTEWREELLFLSKMTSVRVHLVTGGPGARDGGLRV